MPGVPQAIVWHLGDQPTWGKKVQLLGVGPAPIAHHRLTARWLRKQVDRMLSDTAMQDAAAGSWEQDRRGKRGSEGRWNDRRGGANVKASHDFDLDAYFARVDYRGPRKPTLDVLHRITAAHAQSIPFENLDVLLGRPIELDIESLFRQTRHRATRGILL